MKSINLVVFGLLTLLSVLPSSTYAVTCVAYDKQGHEMCRWSALTKLECTCGSVGVHGSCLVGPLPFETNFACGRVEARE